MSTDSQVADWLKQTGITYRQLDYWVTRGYIPGTRPGTGRARSFTPTALKVAEVMGRLVKCGLSPETAARVANHHACTGAHVTELGPNIWLVFDSCEQDPR